MATTAKAALRYPVSSDSPNIAQYFQNLANDTDTKVIIPVANQAGRDALGTTGNLTVQRADTGDYESNYGGSWSRVAGPLIQAKAWRTTGFSSTMVDGVVTTVDLTSATLSGGFTFDNTANTLTIPANGHYELRGRGYASGGVNYAFDCRIVRQRSAVSDLDIVISPKGRKPDAFDEQVYFTDTLPLQAADKILLRTTFSGSVGGATYWGSTQYLGVFLAARYVGPLAGATPV